MFTEHRTKIKTTSRQLGQCLICGDAAVGVNFAVRTCASCKAFFRRNAVKLGRIDFVCQFDGDCPITNKYRRSCNCCRLAKCFRVGMQKSLILSDGEREARKQLIQQNRQKRSQFAIMDRIDLIRPSNLLLSAQSEFKCLSLSDQTVLTNIISAYQRTYISATNNQLIQFPSQPHLCLHTLFNEYNDRHMSLIEYLKLIPEFNQISTNDKVRLIKNHYGTMVLLNESRNQPNEHSTSGLALRDLYGIDIAASLYKCMRLILEYEYDPILIQLLLIVCSLSSGISRNLFYSDMDHIYDNTQLIFAGQNRYVELLWRYILSRIPSEREAVKFFNKLTLKLLGIIRVSFILDSFVCNYPEEIDQMVILMQSMWPRSKQTVNNGYSIPI